MRPHARPPTPALNGASAKTVPGCEPTAGSERGRGGAAMTLPRQVPLPGISGPSAGHGAAPCRAGRALAGYRDPCPAGPAIAMAEVSGRNNNDIGRAWHRHWKRPRAELPNFTGPNGHRLLRRVALPANAGTFWQAAAHRRHTPVPATHARSRAARSQDDGTTAMGPSAWFRTACLTEPGPGRPWRLSCLPMTTRSARADRPASARPGWPRTTS
jgi:hypothetical protein